MTWTRTTLAELKAVLDRINERAGVPLEPYSTDADGKLSPNAGVYLIDGAYGGWKLSRMSLKPGCTGQTSITHGYVPKRELADLMRAYLAGMKAGDL